MKGVDKGTEGICRRLCQIYLSTRVIFLSARRLKSILKSEEKHMKKKIKQILSVALAVIMLIGIAPATGINLIPSASAVSGTCGENVTYDYDEATAVLTISGSGAMTNYLYYNSPWTSHRDEIKKIIIGDGITGIGDYAFFGCHVAESVTIPDGVVRIGKFAFDDCSGLKEVILPESVRNIEWYAFAECTGLESINIPYGVTEIDKYAFYETAIKSIVIPESVKRIKWFAFLDCKNLADITLPNDLESIGEDAFRNTAYFNNEANWEDGILYLDNYVINASADITSATLRPSTIMIADNAFELSKKLESIVIPSSVEKIGNCAFMNCQNLKAVTIPGSVKKIGLYALAYCTSLESITVDKDNKFYDSRNNCNAIIETATNTLIAGCSTTAIPEDISDISEGAFAGCAGLSQAVIPSGITQIGVINADGDGKEMNLTIGRGVFSDCTDFKSIVIPKSITHIGKYAFVDCKNLRDIYYTGSAEEWAAITKEVGLEGAELHFNYGHEHELRHVVNAPSCSEDGIEYDYCTICEEVFNKKVLEKTGHTWGEWTVVREATSKADGLEIRTCKNCSEKEERKIDYVAFVRDVSVDDITMKHKKKVKIEPKITADEGAEYTVKYESSNKEVLTVDKDGNIKTVSRGTATVTVTVTDSNGHSVSDTCKITVKYTFWQGIIQWIIHWLFRGTFPFQPGKPIFSRTSLTIA